MLDLELMRSPLAGEPETSRMMLRLSQSDLGMKPPRRRLIEQTTHLLCLVARKTKPQASASAAKQYLTTVTGDEEVR